MRIGVVDVAASSGGALSILNGFYRFVRANVPQHDWVFVVSTSELEQCAHIKIVKAPGVKRSWIHRLAWEYLSAAELVRAFKPAVVFSLQNLCVPNLELPQVICVHQAIPFQNDKKFSFLKRDEVILAVYQSLIGRMIYSSIRKADGVIVQTRWMKRAIIERIPSSADKIRVVSPTAEKEKAGLHLNNEGGSGKYRFFYPAAAMIYKNHSCLVRAVRIIVDEDIRDFEVIFTISGSEGYTGRKILKEASGLEKYIHFEGYISREAVLKEYERSTLVFPSYIETYGLPLLEARQAGRIIIASDCEFSREILEGYENALFFDPFRPEELAGHMKACISGSRVYHNDFSGTIQEHAGWQAAVDFLAELGRC